MRAGTDSIRDQRELAPGSRSEHDATARWYSLLMLVMRGIFGFELSQVLTLLTMAIGSLALASTLFIGEGALSHLWEDLDRLLGRQVVVYPDSGPNQTLLASRPHAELTIQDFEHLRAELEDIRFVAPQYYGKGWVELGAAGRSMPIDGIAPRLEHEPAYRAILGQGFSERGRQGLVWECMLTEEAVEVLNLEWGRDEVVRVGDQRFKVVAIVASPPQADPRFRARVIVPYATAHTLWGRPGIVSNIVVAWDGPEKMASTIAALRGVLDETRAPDAYFLSSSQFKISQAKNIVSNFMLVGVFQAFFCILVAAIGVVNVMLANVVRRSREFAIRIAMGAKQTDIVWLVLAESAMLGLVGALLGTMFALFLSGPMSNLLASRIAEAAEIAPSFGPRGFLVPVIVCCLSGLAAGVIPALRVRKLDLLAVLRGWT